MMRSMLFMVHMWHAAVGIKTHSAIDCFINCIYVKQFDIVNISSADTCGCRSKLDTKKVVDQNCFLQELYFSRSSNSSLARDRLYTTIGTGCVVSVRTLSTASSSISQNLRSTLMTNNSSTYSADQEQQSTEHITASKHILTTTEVKTTAHKTSFKTTEVKTTAHKTRLKTTEVKSTAHKNRPKTTDVKTTAHKTRLTTTEVKTTTHKNRPKTTEVKTTAHKTRLKTTEVKTTSKISHKTKPRLKSTPKPKLQYPIEEKPTWPEMKNVPCSVRKDCATLQTEYGKRDGIYTINPGDGGSSFKVYCEMQTYGGGWTVIQRRKDGSESFYRTHKEYAHGFGRIDREFWLGNDKIHRLVKEPSRLMFDLRDYAGHKRYQIYNPFYVGGSDVNYKLKVGKNYGTAGDSFSGSSGRGFSTKDSDHDFNAFISCAKVYGGGWWYKNCEEHLLYYTFLGANVNGKYKGKGIGLSWRTWNNHGTNLKFTAMKIRAKSFSRDCSTLKAENPRLRSGLYTVYPGGLQKFKVYCDMTTDGGGWTVLQKRFDGSENFNRKFEEYKDGFGNKKKEFWLGLNYVHHLTDERPTSLRFDLTDHHGQTRFALYDAFSIGDKSTQFLLKLGKYSGNAGNSFGSSDNQYFNTNDKSNRRCWSGYKGGWWYKGCGDSDINGVYGDKKGFGVKWKAWHGLHYSLKRTEMKIRRTDTGVDCDTLRGQGYTSGIYSINPDWGSKFKVYCNMTVDGFGWMVVQRRLDGSENYWQKWNEYKKGFGNKNGEFWIGNEYLHRATGNRKHIIRFDMEDFDGDTRYAVYRDFSVASEADFYRLSVGSYCGNAGDSFSYHNGMKFSTIDRDNDIEGDGECSKLYNGGWWYKNCHEANPNGKYNSDDYGQGINWKLFRGESHSIKYIEMKIRRQ